MLYPIVDSASNIPTFLAFSFNVIPVYCERLNRVPPSSTVFSFDSEKTRFILLTSQCSGIIPIQGIPLSFIFTSGLSPLVTTLAISASFSSLKRSISFSFSAMYSFIP